MMQCVTSVEMIKNPLDNYTLHKHTGGIQVSILKELQMLHANRLNAGVTIDIGH